MFNLKSVFNLCKKKSVYFYSFIVKMLTGGINWRKILHNKVSIFQNLSYPIHGVFNCATIYNLDNQKISHHS